MTLEEAIKHAEEVMVENLEKTKGRNASDPIAMNCFECAKEHLQLEKWLKELKQLREQTRWIPVSERLPTKEEYIANNGLFIVSDGNRTYAEYFDVYNSMKYFGEPTMDGFRVDKCVIAWMPLPEPYKAESENKE